MSTVAEIERSIITTYRKKIWRPFVDAVKKYRLVREGDKVGVCISGGKDSFLLAKCMQELSRHGDFPLPLEFIVMDPGYSKENRALLQSNAEKLGVPVRIFESDIFAVVTEAQGGSPCYLCARMRRGYLYEYAKSLGCNKIALGHHFDDAVGTTLLSLFYGAEVKTMLPRLQSTSHKGMELIRPLYGVKECDIIAWAKKHELTFLNCACRFTERVANKEEESKRKEMKTLLSAVKEFCPSADENVFRAVHNVNLDCLPAWKKKGVRHVFYEEFDGEPDSYGTDGNPEGGEDFS